MGENVPRSGGKVLAEIQTNEVPRNLKTRGGGGEIILLFYRKRGFFPPPFSLFFEESFFSPLQHQRQIPTQLSPPVPSQENLSKESN